jgi:carboxyl-terminal processing protease
VFTTRKGKKLYGSGGVTPDIVLNGDTLSYNFEERLLFNPGLISDFSFALYKQYQPQVRANANAAAFNKSFALSANDWNRFIQAAKEDSIEVNQISAKTKQDLEVRIKANMARFVWRSNGFFTVIQPGDKQLAAAIEYLRKQ